jgi:hypothetical protein
MLAAQADFGYQKDIEGCNVKAQESIQNLHSGNISDGDPVYLGRTY